jgi:Tfp pilus assembly protein PilV
MLLEALFACAVVVVGLMGAFALLDASAKTSSVTKAREGATNLAREILEDAHAIPFSEIAPSTITAKLQAMNGLANASHGSNWQIVRRGYTYTVTVNECSVDEPKDGLAKSHDGSFCSGQPEWKTGETVDSAPVDFKRVTVEVSWVAAHTSHTTKEVGNLNAAAAESGLSASELKLASTTPETSGWEPKSPTIASSSVTQLNFSVSAPQGTTAMIWSVDGVTQSPAPEHKSGAEWTFSWTISSSSPSDGTYQVAAQAEQANGSIGPAISIPVSLARAVPKAPEGVMGGFNTVYITETETRQVVELKWQPNGERNVIGYRVKNPSGAEVCPTPASPPTLSLANSCIDLSPPAPTSANLTYSVTALYRDASGNVQEGPATNFTPVGTPISTYALAPSEGNTGTNCTGPKGNAAKKDMLLSYTPGSDSTAGATTVFCSNAFAGGETIGGSGPLTAYFANASTTTSCTITGEATLNGTEHGPPAVEKTIPANTAVKAYEFNFTYSVVFEPPAGSRVDVVLIWGSGTGCANTTLHYGSSTYPSNYQSAPKPLPEPPKPPTELKVAPQANGTAILTWVAPSSGTSVSFYRIYRDGRPYTARYDTADVASSPEYTDVNRNSAHTYYVTAVSSSLAESAFAGPVTG